MCDRLSLSLQIRFNTQRRNTFLAECCDGFRSSVILVDMPDVTQILFNIENGDPSAADQLLPLVYQELRKLAAAKLAKEGDAHSVQPTMLVHEAYLRLVDVDQPPHWDGRGHFFAAAAEAMRRILVENVRSKRRVKRGGQFQRQDFQEANFAAGDVRDPDELLAVHEALELLAVKSPRKAELVKLRYFVGCTLVEVAQILGVAQATAEDDWRYAKAWLHRQLSRE
ncbi:sigma-70 family RNA polymerase sigma factor [Novipirellula artificiosorum]|uniref:sigma-70 family RNA polymerase sigma factor n=1 Tax=Novipirellula artificiosorum TaxID=2528016 RepID=UPI001E361249|nr:sigma-70 family RNA polymerase sigma factor [Novipirellula artificiosorum]